MVAISMVSIFTGSFVSVRKTEKYGLIVGILIGFIYVLLSFGIGIELSNDVMLWGVFGNKLLAGSAAGALGGVVGANFSGK